MRYLESRLATFTSRNRNATNRSTPKHERSSPPTSVAARLCVALAASIAGGLGCGAAPTEETVAEAHEAASISTWNQLVAMSSTGSHTLTADIDAAGKTWTPKSFSAGAFDGNNKTIKNLTISGGSFFSSLTDASIKNLKFTNLTITGSTTGEIGGLATTAFNTTIQNCAVEASINVTASAIGGIVGRMRGGSIERSYAKGTISGSTSYAGGLVGIADVITSGIRNVKISQSYAQVTVNPSTSSSNSVVAGGIIGFSSSSYIFDVYAVGNVTGRGSVGGIVGYQSCTVSDPFQLYKTIYRGDVVDKSWGTGTGGWAGAVGLFSDCTARMEQNFYDRSVDASSNWADHYSVVGYTTNELRSPTTVTGGVYCFQGSVPGHCGDNTWSDPPWTAGTSSQHHALRNMPGPNSQPR
jgi:hypothetical protein